MATWAEFEAAAPDLASTGRQLLDWGGHPGGFLATVRGADLAPRIHPVSVGIVEGRLLTFVIVGSPKLADLVEDGRYALHAHQDAAAPGEFMVRGRAREVVDTAFRDRVAAGWFFTADDGYRLFELQIEHAVVGDRPTADDWPPIYRSWRA